MNSSSGGLGPTRARVLALLQAAGEPVSVADVAEGLDLHRNSVRFHLDALVNEGYAERETSRTGTLGRPPLRFSAAPTSPTIGNLHLIELIQVLFSRFVAGQPDSARRAQEAGREWGAALATQEGPSNPNQIFNDLLEHLRDRGFGATGNRDVLTFTRCPFRDTVSPEFLPLVCSFHSGFIQGFLAKSKSGLRTTKLEVGDEICRAHFVREQSA